jgi:nitrate reductase gamma subunit
MILSALFSVLFYAAFIVLVAGVLRRILIYKKTPSPLVIPTTPAPVTRAGVAGRMFREVVFFESLFKGSKWSWLFGWLFHFGMLVVLVRHLRYFTDPVWQWVAMMQWIGIYAGMAMLLGLVGLLIRRSAVDRLRYISAPSDYLMLALLIAIAGTGLLMKYVWHTDIVALKAFVLGMMSFQWAPLPADPLLLLHLFLVIALMLVFPISKLLHAPGIFFSPTRNMVDNPREVRHVAAWSDDDAKPTAAPGN